MADKTVPPNSGGRFVIDADGVRRRVQEPTAPPKKSARDSAPPKPAAKAKATGAKE